METLTANKEGVETEWFERGFLWWWAMNFIMMIRNLWFVESMSKFCLTSLTATCVEIIFNEKSKGSNPQVLTRIVDQHLLKIFCWQLHFTANSINQPRQSTRKLIPHKMSLQIHEAFSYPAAYNNLPKNLNILHKSRLCLHFPLCPLFIQALSSFLFRFTEPNYSNEPEKSSERQRYERQNFLHEKNPEKCLPQQQNQTQHTKKNPFHPTLKGVRRYQKRFTYNRSIVKVRNKRELLVCMLLPREILLSHC